MESRQNSVCVKHLIHITWRNKETLKMNIGGFQKNSLIDFPETIACILFTQGCNFICPYCHNPDLVPGPQKRAGNLYDENKIFEFLEKRKGFIEGVVITGGEPTLQKDLMIFCKKVKKMGYKLKLDSKGKFDIQKIYDSSRLLMEKAPAYEFRTTCARPFVSREIIKNIGEMISGASTYILQKCSQNVNVLDPEFLKKETHFFSDSQMLELKETIDKYVGVSVVR